jgi:hypothetical protein
MSVAVYPRHKHPVRPVYILEHACNTSVPSMFGNFLWPTGLQHSFEEKKKVKRNLPYSVARYTTIGQRLIKFPITPCNFKEFEHVFRWEFSSDRTTKKDSQKHYNNAAHIHRNETQKTVRIISKPRTLTEWICCWETQSDMCFSNLSKLYCCL